MHPAPIAEFAAPTTVSDALHARAAPCDGEVAFIAGGQSLMQALKARLVRIDRLIDLGHVSELRGIQGDGVNTRIGALTRYVELQRSDRLHGAYGALIDAASHVGDRQVRNRGTLGGSLCWNYVAACCPTAILALGAELELARLDDGEVVHRRISIDAFLTGALSTARLPDELLTTIHLAPRPATSGSAYRKWGLVTDALPVIGLAVSVAVDGDGTLRDVRVAIGGLSNGAARAPAAETLLAGVRTDDTSRIDAAFADAARDARTLSDLWATDAYRKHLIREMGPSVLALAVERARGGH